MLRILIKLVAKRRQPSLYILNYKLYINWRGLFYLEPFLLKPIFKDYIWGGDRLRKEYNKVCDLKIIAESWELTNHKSGSNIIENGEFKGKTLNELISTYGDKITGTNTKKFGYFPILVKLIDAKDNLSVQVHPNNEYALRVEGEFGKTEMWYIVDCDENAELIYGFKNEISKKEFKERIENNTLLEVTNSVKVKKGDVFFIDVGTLHAIGKGILIAEIQQNSDTTYRVYDYNRVGADGKPRELHINKALDVTSLTPVKLNDKQFKIKKYEGYLVTNLSTCEYFTVDILNIDTNAKLIADETSFHNLLVIEGNFEINDLNAKKGDSLFIPANLGEYNIVGKGKIILTRV